MKKKKFIIIIVIFLLILIGLIVSLKMLTSKKEADEELQVQLTERKDETDEDVKKYFSDKICPQGMATIYGQYHGSNDMNDLYRSLYKLETFIEESYDEITKLDDNGVQEYYKKNWWNLKKELGITSAEKLSEFVKYLKSVDFENAKYDHCELDKESYQEEENYLTFNISFSYEGKDDLLKFKTYFAYRKNMEPEIKFEPII